jgi:hypothetical protein
MFGIDSKEIKRLERDLKFFAKRAYPFATKKTLNDGAFQAQKIARADVQKKMVNRNRYTVQSIRVDQARTLDVNRQMSVIGSTADYMEDQEFGAIKTKSGKEGVSIPTSYSSGEGDNARPRKRLPRKPNRMSSIKLTKNRRRAKNRKQANLFKVQNAVTTGKRIVFMDFGRKKGIFRVIGGRKKFKRGWPKGAKVRQLHDMSEPSVVIPRNPWLKPAFDEAVRMLPAFYADALRFQLKRNQLFKSR